jgi:hypothetical protein
MRLVAGGRVEVQKNQKNAPDARPLNGASFDPRAPLGKPGARRLLGTSFHEACAAASFRGFSLYFPSPNAA